MQPEEYGNYFAFPSSFGDATSLSGCQGGYIPSATRSASSIEGISARVDDAMATENVTAHTSVLAPLENRQSLPDSVFVARAGSKCRQIRWQKHLHQIA